MRLREGFSSFIHNLVKPIFFSSSFAPISTVSFIFQRKILQMKKSLSSKKEKDEENKVKTDRF